MKTILPVISALLLMSATAPAAEPDQPSLKVGDPAPKLQVKEWVQGDPVSKFEPDKAYIVEFWATWCGPCRVSIPHLNEIHLKYKDKGLVVIGQDVWEQDTSRVAPFVKEMGDKMTYRVALDDMEGSERGKMAETWMLAAGQNGIPAAFLIDKQGKIAWIGHPMTLEEKTIEQVLDGTFDVKAAALAYETRRKNENRLRTLWQEIHENIEKKDWAKAESGIEEMRELLPAGERMGVDMARFRMELARQDGKAASALAKSLSEAYPTNPMLQNELAWQLVATKGLENVDLNVAESIALKANKATDEQDPSILDTVARVYYLQGKKDKAIELQEKAVKLAPEQAKGHLQRILDSYKEDKLPDVE